MAGAWEQAVNSVLPSDQPIRDRNDLAGPGSPPWVEDAGIQVGGTSPDWDVVRGGTTTVFNNGQASTLTVQVWAKLNWGLFQDNYTLQQLFSLGQTWLDPLARGGGNTVTRQPSFGELATNLEGARDFLEQKRDEVANWAKQIESSDNLDGVTAKSLQSILQSLSRQIGAFSAEISDSLLIGKLRSSGDKLGTELNQLLDKFIDWRNGSSIGNSDAWSGWDNNKNYADPVNNRGGEDVNLSNPAHAVAAAMNKYQLTVNMSYNKNNGLWEINEVQYGLGDGGGLKEALDREAKQEWLNYYTAKLDPGTTATFNDVQNEYQATKNNMPSEPKFGPVGAGGDQSGGGPGGDQNTNFDIPPNSQDENLDGPPDTNFDIPPNGQNTDGPAGDQNVDGPAGDQNVDFPSGDQNLDNPSGDQNVDNPSGDQSFDIPPDGGGTGEEDLDAPDTDFDEQDEFNANKNDLTGPNAGNNYGGGSGGMIPPPPVTSFNPAQFTPNGMNNLFPGGGGNGVTGPDGKLLTKPDGSPLQLPEGAKINPDGTVTQADGTPLRDANGNLVRVPPGSSIQSEFPPGSVVNPDGTVTTPDGKQLHDSNGNPIRVPPNSIYHPNAQNSGFYPPMSKWNLPPDLHNPGGNKFSPANPSGLENNKRVGGISPADINDPTRRSTVNSSALDDALRKPVNPATEGGGRGGRGGAGGQQPMMPPPPMGAGGAGNENKERQRTVWLAEDEETWRIEEGFSRAIGR